MSYDIELGEFQRNYTSNVGPMFRAAMPEGIKAIHGARGSIAIMKLRRIRSCMEDSYHKMMELQPVNGWGTYEGALNLINEMILATIRNPHDNWSVSS